MKTTDKQKSTQPELTKEEQALIKKTERKMYSINILVLVALLLVISGFMIFGKRPTKSEEENRDLTKCPQFSVASYLDGTFTSQFAEFFNDTVPMRSMFKGLIADFRSCLGVPYDDGVKLIGNVPVLEEPDEPEETEPPETTVPTEATEASTDSAQMGETQPDTTEATEETTEATTEETTEPEEEDVNGEIANNILIVKDRGLMLYSGTKSSSERYPSLLNQYKAELGEDVNVYSLIAPTAVSYYLPKKYSDYTASEKDNIDYVNTLLEDVQPVDAYSILEEHKDEAIYSRTDHHWQPLGAYYAAQAFAETAGVPFADLSEYETVTKEGYVGTLYGYTNDAVFKDNPEPFIYYKPKNAFTTTYYDIDMTNERQASLMLNLDNLAPVSWYLVFMGGDERITHITTDCDNGRKLMIIKDSYGNALVPCLTQSFSEIWVVDMRYFEPSAIEFAKEHGITDLLFAMNSFSATGSSSKNLEKIMH